MFDKVYPIPAFADNYIWALIDSGSRQVCVVDPGDAAPVLAYLDSQDLSLAQIVITHHHPDHTGGIAALVKACQVPVYGPDNPRISGITHRLAENDSVDILGVEFSVLEVPGHTLDHIAYFSSAAQQPVLFCGDTLFAAGCGRLFEGTAVQMLASLNKLASLPGDTLVYCTHEYTLANLGFALAAEPENAALQQRAVDEKAKRDSGLPTLPSSIDLELATNPFLRCDQQGIKVQVAGQTNQAVTDLGSTFAALRQWKDIF